jgi:hypothetical protein
MKSLKTLILTLGLATAGALQATPIDFMASVDGIAATSDYSFSATGGSVVLGLKNGAYFVGVKGGQAGTEIDGNQSLTVNFSASERLASLSLALLFNGPEYGDNNEIAAAFTSGADTYELRLTGQNAAQWFKNNSWVTNVIGQETSLGGRGLFTIENPFGLSTVTSFKLFPIDTPNSADGSDFGLYAFSTVPDAGSTLLLMGAALIGFAGLARRFRR